ncbi:MAG: glycosyltransferase family A protein [Pseudomonadota bacterium]|nr:glycosyltransferase family A protein [Pseudomonadota bacterium]
MGSLLVVVPVRDGANTLPRCLDALVRALPAGAEIVVVDDGSHDASAAVAARFPVRLVAHAQSRGASAARNTGAAASDAALVAFVDADVVVRPDALTRLVAVLAAEPEASGANGILSLDLSTPGWMSAFANTSIHYQHLCHGLRVASAFTSVCVLRRTALVKMGGWEADTSRYADDVATRWHLPPGSILLDVSAQGEHLKRVSVTGLLKHRFNIGWFYFNSIVSHWGQVRERPATTVLALRYPLNTAAAALSVALLPVMAWAPARPAMLLPAALFVLANSRFALFTLRARGAAEALIAIPLSTIEGFAYMFGICASATMRVWRARERAPTAVGPVRVPVREGRPEEPPPDA